MAAKERSGASDKEQRAKLKKLGADLTRAESRAERWKTRARRSEKAAAEAESRSRKLEKRLTKATRAAEATGASRPAPVPARPPSLALASADGESATSPDSSWTVVRLRDEARSRGLTGTSGKTKVQLLTLLR